MSVATESQVISVCADCVYFNAYGRLDDTTMDVNPNAAEQHRVHIAAQSWPYGTEFTSGCGRDCPDTDPNGTGGCNDYQFIDGELEPDDNAEPEPWFSWSACEQCGSPLGGDREHATATTYNTDTVISYDYREV